MFAISEAASLAFHAAALLSEQGGEPRPVSVLAVRLGVSADHLAKVLQRLSKEGLLVSVRGRRGGYRLGRSARVITLREIYEAVEGPMGRPGCLLGRRVCSGAGCALTGLLHELPAEAARYLDDTTVADLKKAAGLAGER